MKFCLQARTCRISSICVTEGGTRARGRDRASSNFTLKTMVFLKWSRASCRTEGSLPCTRKTTEQFETYPRGSKHTTTTSRVWRRLCTCTGWKMACSMESTSQKKKSHVSARESSNFWPASIKQGAKKRVHFGSVLHSIFSNDVLKQSYLRRTWFCPEGWPCL